MSSVVKLHVGRSKPTLGEQPVTTKLNEIITSGEKVPKQRKPTSHYGKVPCSYEHESIFGLTLSQ